MRDRTAVIIGGGPAGLTAALELLERTTVKPVVFEGADDVGGIARTFVHNGNHIDIGGHRFFSKSDRVMAWWRRILPLQGPTDGRAAAGGIRISYQNASRWLDLPADGPDPETVDDVMLIRKRRSRILWRGRLFDYPLSLSLDTLQKLGLASTLRVGTSYLGRRVRPRSPEATLEDFFINRFGDELYATFFRDYTEKVWGVPCAQISADWGAQRVKGVSLQAVLKDAWRKLTSSSSSLRQHEVETSLIEQFLYPKYGPGQMWRKVAALVHERGGEVHLNARIEALAHDSDRITHAVVRTGDGGHRVVAGDLFFSSAPVRDLVLGFDPPAPEDVRSIARGLLYRDFVTVGILARTIRLGGGCTGRDLAAKMPDNWIYVQEPGVKVGRLQFFNNWSPFLVADPATVWIGMEYFCDEGDELWTMPEDRLAAFATKELSEIGVCGEGDVIDAVVIRVPKTYPAYFGRYGEFDRIRAYVDRFENLFLIGRNGMHRYNNQDHSMLAAMVAVDNVAAGRTDKANVWAVNTEQDYHEEK